MARLARPTATATDAELPVEGVADRLGLPVGMLIRRIEAGDIPARRDDSSGQPRFHLRLSDLGITAEEAAIFHGNQNAAESRGVHDSDEPEDESVMDLTGRPGDAAARVPAGSDPGAAAAITGTLSIEDVLPPPVSVARSTGVAIVEDTGGPRAELASMTIDPRELVAGLLDRWERTLEQRIYAEQRQRFEGELNNRLHQVKELRMELHAVRADHAAAMAETDLLLATKERELADRERALAEERSKPIWRGWFNRR